MVFYLLELLEILQEELAVVIRSLKLGPDNVEMTLLHPFLHFRAQIRS